MATDQTNIALDACAHTVNAVTALLDALDKLESIQEKLAGAEINLVDYQTEIEAASGIKHCAPTTYKDILSAFVPHIVSDLKTYPDGDPVLLGWNALQKARL